MTLEMRFESPNKKIVALTLRAALPIRLKCPAHLRGPCSSSEHSNRLAASQTLHEVAGGNSVRAYFRSSQKWGWGESNSRPTV